MTLWEWKHKTNLVEVAKIDMKRNIELREANANYRDFVATNLNKTREELIELKETTRKYLLIILKWRRDIIAQ